MSIKRPIKPHLNFAASSMIRQQKSSEGFRASNTRSKLDESLSELSKNELVFTNASNEWKEKNEELVKENSYLRAQLQNSNFELIEEIKKNYEIELQNLRNESKHFQNIVKNLTNEFDKLKIEKKNLEKKLEEVEIRENKLLEENFHMKANLLEKNKTIEGIMNQIEELLTNEKFQQKQSVELRNRFEMVLNEKNELEEKFKENIEKTRKNYEKVIEEQKLEIEGLKQQIEVNNERYALLENICKENDKLMQVFNKEKQGLLQNIEKFFGVIKKKSEKIKRLKQDLAFIHNEAEKLKLEYGNLTKTSKEFITMNKEYEKIRLDHEELLFEHKKCENTQQDYIKLLKIHESLEEKLRSSKTLNNDFNSLREILLGFVSSIQSILPLNSLFQFSQYELLFSSLSNHILASNSDLNSKNKLIQNFEASIKTYEGEISYHKKENQELSSKLESLSALLKNSEHSLSSVNYLEQKLQTLMDENSVKDEKIEKLKAKICQLQEEIKHSFAKIDLLKTQVALNDKNLLLVQSLQEANKEEAAQKNHYKEQFELLKKKNSQLENETKKRSFDPSPHKNDVHSMLIQKIESMKFELEHYNPSESTAQQEIKVYKAAISKVFSYTNKIDFIAKSIEENFACKTCLQVENIEIYACGHLNCIICEKSCKKCHEDIPKLNTSIFYFLSRKLKDLKKSLCDLKSIS